MTTTTSKITFTLRDYWHSAERAENASLSPRRREFHVERLSFIARYADDSSVAALAAATCGRLIERHAAAQ